MSEEEATTESNAQTAEEKDNESSEVTTLEEAMSALREQDKTDSAADVERTENVAEQPEEGEQAVPDRSEGEDQVEVSRSDQAQISTESRYDSGSSVSTQSDNQTAGRVQYTEEGVDTARTQMSDAVARQAVSDVSEEFANMGLQKITVSSLIQQNENTGEVSFINPEAPQGSRNSTFASRSEAQAWVESYNRWIDEEFRARAAQRQSQYTQALEPTFKLMEFAPRFSSLPKDVQDTLDVLIENYEVKDNTGKVIGYSCDLNAEADRAMKIVAQNEAKSRTQKTSLGTTNKETAPTGPATDMKTTGSEHKGAQRSDEPRDLADAMRILKEQNASKRNASKKGK